MLVKRIEKYCVSENCIKLIRLGLYYEDEFDIVEEVLDRYYKLF